MADDDTDRLLKEIGQLLAEDRAYPLDGTLLYAEVGHNMVGPSIFKALGNQILYRRPDLDRLGDALLDLWEAQDTDDRWAEIEYLIRDGKFDATYTYPDEIDPDENSMDRRDRVVRQHFGDKPIIYPPWPPEDDAPDYDLQVAAGQLLSVIWKFSNDLSADLSPCGGQNVTFFFAAQQMIAFHRLLFEAAENAQAVRPPSHH